MPCHARLLPRLLSTLLVVAGMGGCGCGDALRPETLNLAPMVLEANSSTPCRLAGIDFGDGPVSIVMIDASGERVGPVRTAQPDADGSGIDMLTPLLPELRRDVRVTVQIQTADGRIARTGSDVLIVVREGDVRRVDGRDNSPEYPDIGAAGAILRRDVPAGYDDQIVSPARSLGPSPRLISNVLVAQPALPPQTGAVPSDLFWAFGQFVDHDLDLTPEATPAEPLPVPIPSGDPSFDPTATGTVMLPFQRSSWLAGSGSDAAHPRTQINTITSWLDASNVYGSDPDRAQALRALDGTGQLRTSAGELLPFNTSGLPNAPASADTTLFLAGDVRANEQLGLTALHTVFVREHNRVARMISAANPHLDGDAIYDAARRFVGAELQAITYNEFLPILLGPSPLATYGGYNPFLDASISVLFSTAAFRLGHTMVGPLILRLTPAGTPVPEGHLALRDAFFQPGLLVTEGGVDPVLRGLAAQPAQRVDPYIVDDLRNFLFGPPGAGGLDLASLNVQRGRDHGLPDYNRCRVAYGLSPRTTFDEVTSDPELRSRLTTCYASPDVADPWPLMLAEDPLPGILVGETLRAVLVDQFRRLRDADRFWYQRIFGGEALAELEGTRLADVIRRTTGIGSELSDTPLLLPAVGSASAKPRRSSTRSPEDLRTKLAALTR